MSSFISSDPDNKSGTIAIKKTTHITVFYHDLNQLLVENCVDKLKSNDSGIHYTQFPDADKIICNLEAAEQNASLPVIQATRRFFKDNNAVNAVYTYFKDASGTDQQGHGYTADLTWFSTYTRDMGHTTNSFREFMVANILTNSNSTLSAFANFPLLDSQEDLDLITDLAIAVDNFYYLEGNYFRQFNSKIVHNVIEKKTLWLALVIALPVTFLCIVILTSFCISKPYRTDLRTLLINSVKQQERNDIVLEDINRKKITLGNDMKSVKIDRLKHKYNTQLTMNDVPITLITVDKNSSV